MENFFKYFTTIYFETTDPSKTIQDLLKILEFMCHLYFIAFYMQGYLYF